MLRARLASYGALGFAFGAALVAAWSLLEGDHDRPDSQVHRAASGTRAAGAELAPRLARPGREHTWHPTTRVSPAPPSRLSDPHVGARLDAVIDLSARADPDAVAALAAAAIGDVDSSVRLEAVAALAARPGEAARQALTQALADPDPEVRREAVEALAQMGGTASVQALAEALLDADSALRAEAVDALGDLGGERAIELMRQAANTDESPAVRRTAQDYLVDLPGAQ